MTVGTIEIQLLLSLLLILYVVHSTIAELLNQIIRGTGVRGNQDPLVVKGKVGRPLVSFIKSTVFPRVL